MGTVQVLDLGPAPSTSIKHTLQQKMPAAGHGMGPKGIGALMGELGGKPACGQNTPASPIGCPSGSLFSLLPQKVWVDRQVEEARSQS